jgi:cytoskeletal protein CcmA (bactofilin family)
MSVRRWLIASAAIGVALVALLAPAALAQSSGADAASSGNAFVVLTGRLDVRSGDTFDDAVILDGDATIDGTVTRTVMAFNGDVTVSGTVGQDVVAINGRVTVKNGATVDGNVISSKAPLIAPGATVNGDVNQQSFNVDFGNLALVSRIAYWIAASVSSFLIGLLLTLAWPRVSDAIAAAARERVGPSIGWGAIMFFGLPIVGGLLLVTLVGALLGIGILLALVLIYSIGYAAGAFALGRLMLKPPTNRFLAFLLGWGILRLVALVPVLGVLLFVAMSVWGLGAITVAAYRASRGTGATAPVLTQPPGAAPLPPMPTAP